MGMFTTKPPFDLPAFLAQKATSKPSGRRPGWSPKPAVKADDSEKPTEEE